MMPMKALAEALRLLSALRKSLTDEVHAVIWRFNSAACFSSSFLRSIRCLSSLEPSILPDSFFTHASTEELNFATACAVLPVGLPFLSNKAIRASTTSRQAPYPAMPPQILSYSQHQLKNGFIILITSINFAHPPSRRYTSRLPYAQTAEPPLYEAAKYHVLQIRIPDYPGPY